MRRIASAAAAKKWPGCPSACVVRADEPEVRFVDQGGRLERLAGLLLGQLAARPACELVVDQRQELLGGLRVALLDGREDAGHSVMVGGHPGHPLLPPPRPAPRRRRPARRGETALRADGLPSSQGKRGDRDMIGGRRCAGTGCGARRPRRDEVAAFGAAFLPCGAAGCEPLRGRAYSGREAFAEGDEQAGGSLQAVFRLSSAPTRPLSAGSPATPDRSASRSGRATRRCTRTRPGPRGRTGVPPAVGAEDGVGSGRGANSGSVDSRPGKTRKTETLASPPGVRG